VLRLEEVHEIEAECGCYRCGLAARETVHERAAV
jgi:hypothetical protein